MLFHVKMTVNLPVDMNPEAAAKLKADEKALAQRDAVTRALVVAGTGVDPVTPRFSGACSAD